uniref:Microsomal glutathione S-transferase 1 n=1 Tax=Rhodnius prolixus TaxID=13249 RepID=T1HCK9_RHOPR
MAPLTGRLRFSKGIFASPEDCVLRPKSRVVKDDPDIERVRRAHLNDLENIPIYFIASLAYLLTEPNAWLAINLMRAFTFARIAHSLVYAVVVVPQPARAIAWGIGYAITGYMAYKVMMEFW